MNHRNVITPVFDVLRAASEAVREGCLSNEEGEDEEEEDPLDTPNSARSGPKDFTMVSNRDVSIVEECTAQEESGANA